LASPASGSPPAGLVEVGGGRQLEFGVGGRDAGLVQVFADQQVEEQLAHAGASARPVGAPDLGRSDADAGVQAQVPGEHPRPRREADDEDEQERASDREQRKIQILGHGDGGILTPGRPPPR
jgi:hypothetical protein